jgi:hypothetical protein
MAVAVLLVVVSGVGTAHGEQRTAGCLRGTAAAEGRVCAL